MTTEQLLNERGKTHGSFDANAEIGQELKTIFRDYRNKYGGKFTDVQLEGLDMIALKLCRILSGQADYAEHWRDIAGYATLVADRCSK